MSYVFTLLWLFGLLHMINAATNCQFTVRNPKGDVEVYDFSSLSATTPWEISDASDSKSKSGVLFLSICRPLESLLPSQCPDKSASSCLTRRENDKWKTVISNAGSSRRQPQLNYVGRQLVFSLEGDQLCKNGKNYSTNIHFSCNPQTIGEPYFMGLSNECDVQLGWVSSTACKVTPDHDTCLLPVPGGRPLDLTPLASPTFYNVTDTTGRVFEINFCKEIREGTCKQSATVCIRNSTTVIGEMSDATELSHIPQGLKLTYLEATGASTTINFICNLTAPLKPEPIFIAENNKAYTFRVDTPFACPAAPIDCVAYDSEGRKFDLNPLRSSTDLWTVRDERKGKSHILYHLNVCGPLPRGLINDCLAGNVGACMTNSKPNAPSYSLGLVEQPPKVTKEGTVLLEYRGGSPCKQSKFRRRVSIALECSQKDQGPQLEAVHDDCSYVFLWRTPAACPARPVEGDNCRVADVNLGYTFDMRGLYNNQADYQIDGDGDDSFRVNLCGSLHTPCAKYDDVSVCLKRGGKEIAIGRRDDRLLYQDGRLSFKLTGDECQPGVNSSVTIILSCEHQDPQAVSPTPQVFPFGQNECRFFMVWNHPKACPPYVEVPCSVRDEDGTLYDLSDLAWRSGNHEAHTNGKRSGLMLNVCRSVVFGRDSPCEPSAGACLHEGGKFINAGDIKQGPYIENGQLKLKYEQGAMCKLPEGPDHMSTIIQFVCVEDKLESEPLYLGEELCVHKVMWLTASACGQRYDAQSKSDSCTVVNPLTKFRFNFTSLQNKEFIALDENDDKYILSVCTPLKNSTCGQGAGSCKISPGNNENAGMVGSNLQFRQGGSLFLNYTDGAPCGDGKRMTLIEFMCGAEGSIEGPRVIDVLGDCITVVHWHTELACEKRVHCIINTVDQEVDLSPLIRVTQNYRASAPDGRDFFINVCRPVVSVPGLSCPAGSGVCVARRHNNTYVNELSLGFPLIKPVSTAKQEANLMYIHGSPCPGTPGINISSVIRFKCDPRAGQGNPFFVNQTDDCQYQFDWSTSLLCGEREEKTGPCSVFSEQLNRNISLESLQKPGGYHTKSKGNRKYSLNLCGDSDICKGAAVCQNSDSGWVSHGTLQKALYDYQNDYLKLQYSGGISCTSKNDTYGAEVWLRCDEAAGIGGPKVITEHVCFVIFEWRTSAMCKQRTTSTTPKPNITPGKLPSTTTSTTIEPSTSVLAAKTEETSSAGTIVAAIFGIAVTLALLVLIAMYALRRGNMCLPSWRLAGWLRSPTHSQVHYSRVASADEASHLLSSQPELEWDSDEELLKV